MYIVLLLILFFLLSFCLVIYNREILAPPVIVLLMFVFTGIIGLIRWLDWELYNYSPESVLLLLTGILSFVLSSGYALEIYGGGSVHTSSGFIKRNRIDITGLSLFLFLIIGVCANASYYIAIRRIVRSLGFNTDSLSAIINHFRNISSAAYFDDMYSLPTIVKILYWSITSIGMFTLFVFIHNIIFRVFKKKDIFLLIVSVLWLTTMLLNSHRSYLLTALAEGIYLLFFFLNMYYGWRPSVSEKILQIGIRLFFALIIGFIALAVLLGRYKSLSDMNLVDYMTVYMSSGIRNFDLFIKKPPEQIRFGSETFASLCRTLNNRLHLGYNIAKPELEFRYIGSLKISNIYTAFRRYYSDFGLPGIIIIPSILGYWFTATYEKIKRRSKFGEIDFNLLLYIYFCKELFQLCLEETVLTYEVSLNGLFKVLLLYFLYVYYIKRKVKIVIRRC